MTRVFFCFSLVAALCAILSAQESGEGSSTPKSNSIESSPGTIEGSVLFRGTPPKNPIPDDSGYRRDMVQVDRKTGGIRDVLAYLEPAPKLQNDPSPKASRPSQLVDQIDHEFIPRVIAVIANKPVTFTNSDPANHNVRTSSPQRKNEFNIYVAQGGEYRHEFQPNPENKPIRISCDIHPWMRGWVYVMEHPYFAVTDVQGRFEIPEVPPGEYRLILAQPDLRYASTQEVRVVSKEISRVAVEIPVKEPGR